MELDNPSATAPLPPTPPPPAATAVAPRTSPSGNDKIWAILSHLSAYIGLPILIPLVVYLVMKDESTYTAENAKEALNFHLSLLIYTLIAGLLIFTIIGIPLVAVAAAVSWIFIIVVSIIAAVKAGEGRVYRYPLSIRLVT